MGALILGKDAAEGKRLLLAAINLAEKKTEADLPEREPLLSAALAALDKVRETETEAAMKRLAQFVKAASAPNGLERALAAYHAFKKQYGETEYVKSNAETMDKIAAELNTAIFENSTEQLPQLIRTSNWHQIVANAEKTIEEMKKVGSVSDEHRKTLRELIRFGQGYVAEETIHKEVFSVRPWRLERLAALKNHDNKLVAERAAVYSKIAGISVGRSEKPGWQLGYATREKKGEEAVDVKDVYVRLARYNAVFVHWPKESGFCDRAEMAAALDFRQTGPAGDVMNFIMMDNFARFRRTASRESRGSAEFERLRALARAASSVPSLRSFVIQQAQLNMIEYRDVGDLTVRFCIMSAEQCEALKDDAAATKYFEKLIDMRVKYKDYAWLGCMGRGRIRERNEKYNLALADYEMALTLSPAWWSSYRCAQAIVNLSLHSGKLDKPTHAKQAVAELLKRYKSPEEQASAKKLLEKKQ